MPVCSPYAVFRAEEWLPRPATPISAMPITAMAGSRQAAGRWRRTAGPRKKAGAAPCCSLQVQGELFGSLPLD